MSWCVSKINMRSPSSGTPDLESRDQSENGSSSGWYDLIMVEQEMRGGSGLGLAIARGYARAHGGDLSCEEPRGIGAMFRLILPLEPRNAGVH